MTHRGSARGRKLAALAQIGALGTLGVLPPTLEAAPPTDRPPAPQARAGEPFVQGRCGQTITASVVLTQDLVDCPGDAIRIAADDVGIDGAGHLISGTGAGSGIVAGDVRRASILNCRVRDFDKGIDLHATGPRSAAQGSIGHRISGNTLTGNGHGIFLLWTHDTSITDNRIHDNLDSGITLSGSDSLFGPCSNRNHLIGNTIARNRRGLVTLCPYLPQEGNRCRGNTFAYNALAVTATRKDRAHIDYQANVFRGNLATVFLDFTGSHQLETGRPRSFDVAVFQSDGSACRDFAVRRIDTSPEEKVSHTRSGNHLRGSFTPRRDGLYSLELEVAGCGQESVSQRFWLGQEKATTLFLELGDRHDVGTLVAAPPAEPVRVYCTMWVEGLVREPPDVAGIAKLTRVRPSVWSDYAAQESNVYRNLYGLEFDRTFSRRADVLVAVDGRYPEGRTLVSEKIDGGPFLLDRDDWLNLAVKYIGRNPVWIGTPERPSTVTLEYLLTDHPVIETLSRRDAWLLSATAPVAAAGAEVVLEGRGPTSLTLRMPGRERAYQVLLDGNACGRDPTCRFTQRAGRVHVDLWLDARHVLTIVERSEQVAAGGGCAEG